MGDYEVRILYGNAAILLRGDKDSHLVVGDLHIGLERKLADKGVRIHNATEIMAARLKEIAESNNVKSIIILGDVKESILNPDSGEIDSIREFFDIMSGFNIKIAVGNHDSRLENFIREPISNEVIIGNVALMHGHMWPSDNAMMCDYLIIAHNHVAVSFREENGAFYSQKAWLVSGIRRLEASKRYKSFNSGIKLIVMPAFNDLITGKAVNEMDDKHINPLFRNKIFDYEDATVYSMEGIALGTPVSLKGK